MRGLEEDYDNEKVDPEQEYLSYRVIKDENGEQLVEPFLKIRTLRAWRDIGLSFVEWLFNRRGLRKMGEGLLILGFYIFIWWQLRYMFTYFLAGGIIGGMIAFFLGWIFSRRDMAGLLTWMVEGHKTYLHAVLEELKTTLPKLQYVQSDITAFFMQKVPSHIINQGKMRPGTRGVQILEATHKRFMGYDYYFNNWKDNSNHIYVGGPFSLSAFLIGVSTLDKRVTKISRAYTKRLKKARRIVDGALQRFPVQDVKKVNEVAEESGVHIKGLPNALKLLEMDRHLMQDIKILAQDVQTIEGLIHKNPLQIELRKLNKYTRRFVIAAATYNMKEDLRKTRTDIVPLDTLKDRFNAASAVAKFYEIIPQYVTRVKREFYHDVYAMLEDFTSNGVDTMAEAKKLVRKRLESQINTKPAIQAQPSIEVK